jgi:hypothetical protein
MPSRKRKSVERFLEGAIWIPNDLFILIAPRNPTYRVERDVARQFVAGVFVLSSNDEIELWVAK